MTSPPPRRPVHPWAPVLVLLALACGGDRPGRGGTDDPYRGGDKDGDRRAPGPERRLLIEAGTVQTGSVADHLITSGTLESEAQADITPETTGIVSRVLVEEGDPIRKGQLLAVIRNPSLDAGAERAGLERTKAAEAVGQAERLHAGGAISDRELQDARDALAIAEATHREATSSAGFTRIESPIAGTLAVRELRVGEVAGAAGRAFQVVDLTRLRVIVQLPERDLPRIATGQSAMLTGAYDAEARAAGTIERISPVVDAQTGTVRVTISADPEQTALRPGQFVKVRIEVDRHDDVLTIPRRALLYQDGEPIAWVVAEGEPPAPTGADGERSAGEDPPGFLATLFSSGSDDENGDEAAEDDPWEGIPRRVARKARLVVGFTDPDKVEVVSGLGLGDQVVVVGNASLREAALLRLPDDPMPDAKPDETDDDPEDAG
ncbi:MAG: efflux RND transporter periplasmic adaptor subunit [Myxococcota bacterium]|nr:efflux RND transporter periplasmic adaptor subunit [Myxococcota bacterium]